MALTPNANPMLIPNSNPSKKKHLPHSLGGSLAVPFERLIDHYSTHPVRDMKLRPRKAKTQGKRTRMGLCRFMHELFKQNELLPRNRKLTNETMAKMVMDEFPNQEALHRGLINGGKAGINDYRRRYNMGVLLKDVLPDRISFRYNDQGLAVDSRTGRRLLSIQEQNEISQRYKSKFHSRKKTPRTAPSHGETQ